MDIIWSIVSAVVASILTTLVLNFFLNRMTENAKKPWLTAQHKQLIEMLAHPNAVATVTWPNGADHNYDVGVTTYERISQLEAFDEMVENKIVVPTSPEAYRLSCNYKGKYRKTIWVLAWEEIRFLVGRV